MNQDYVSLDYREHHSDVPSSRNFNNESCVFRVFKLPKERDPYLHIQIIGKAVVFKMLPEKIMRDDMLLYFNRIDIVMITHLGTKNELEKCSVKPENKLFKILKQLFRKGKTTFVIEKEEGVVEEHTANEIYNNNEITEKLSGTDGIKIGYSVAEEHYNKVFQLRKSA